MKLYQPVLYVGLGGTGCDVGAELERRMRDEICGPDGSEFRNKPGMGGMQRYQLPSCIQFVYADVNRSELERLPSRVVPSSEHRGAAERTAHYFSDLVPPVDSYPELARNLRLTAGRETATWLPPEQGEPRVNPLQAGAGQFPTVGRAALYGTFADGIDGALRDISSALGKLANSGTDLHTMSGESVKLKGVDAFVAFSVAGGTGCGIFYDYLHLIGHELQRSQSDLNVRIYPLVLMPSSFQPGLGGGRSAELNAGRALLDLFRLVDQQNAATARLRLTGTDHRRPIDPEDIAVHYPGTPRITLRPGTVQTGFLFSRPAAATREDMHRAMASMVISLVGSEVTDHDQRSGVVPQSFADGFVNEAGVRMQRAENGIGNRGVSTALVASLTVPVDELAGLVAGRLVRSAIEHLSRPQSKIEGNRKEREDFLTKAGLAALLRPQSASFPEPATATGAKDVATALTDRVDNMRGGLDSLRAQLSRQMPQLMDGFHLDAAVDESLAAMDVFRLQRVLFGHTELNDDLDKVGANGLLQRRRNPPAPPNKTGTPPSIPEMHDKFFHKVQWTDEEPVGCRTAQDAWYRWNSNVEWAKAWDAYTPRWRRHLERGERNLTLLTDQLLKFARDNHEDFDRRAEDLYKKRVGVSYMLPTATGRMDQFYVQVITRLVAQRYREGRGNPGDTEPDLLQSIMGPSGWREAYKASVDHGPESALSFLLNAVKTAVKSFLREPAPGETPMLPRLGALLAESVHREPGSGISQEYMDEFKAKLAGMLPANFTPQGSGTLKVLVSYPAGARDENIENYLKQSVNLPAVPGKLLDFRPTQAEGVSIVLFRTGMGVTEVGEVRDVLRVWAGALSQPRPTDMLRWRQRTGYDFGYLATREEHRVDILHRILCALWNGKGSIEGDPKSPAEVSITLGGNVTMPLPLSALGQASSWGSLLRAYELWALDDEDIHRQFCAALMRELPDGLDSRPEQPHPLYTQVTEMAQAQIATLDGLLKKQASNQQARALQMRSFWTDTLPAALDLPFAGLESPVGNNLRALGDITAETAPSAVPDGDGAMG